MQIWEIIFNKTQLNMIIQIKKYTVKSVCVWLFFVKKIYPTCKCVFNEIAHSVTKCQIITGVQHIESPTYKFPKTSLYYDWTKSLMIIDKILIFFNLIQRI